MVTFSILDDNNKTYLNFSNIDFSDKEVSAKIVFDASYLKYLDKSSYKSAYFDVNNIFSKITQYYNDKLFDWFRESRRRIYCNSGNKDLEKYVVTTTEMFNKHNELVDKIIDTIDHYVYIKDKGSSYPDGMNISLTSLCIMIQMFSPVVISARNTINHLDDIRTMKLLNPIITNNYFNKSVIAINNRINMKIDIKHHGIKDIIETTRYRNMSVLKWMIFCNIINRMMTLIFINNDNIGQIIDNTIDDCCLIK